MERMRFKPFIEDLLSPGFDEFVTLYFPGRKKPWEYKNQWELRRAALRDLFDEKQHIARIRRFDKAQNCQERWLAKVREYASDDFRYLMVIEDRKYRRDFMFHLLLGGCDWGQYDFSDHWGPLWKTMSGGIAFQKKIDERIGGLLRHFVLKRHYTLETGNGWRYGAWDFEEWNGY